MHITHTCKLEWCLSTLSLKKLGWMPRAAANSCSTALATASHCRKCCCISGCSRGTWLSGNWSEAKNTYSTMVIQLRLLHHCLSLTQPVCCSIFMKFPQNSMLLMPIHLVPAARERQWACGTRIDCHASDKYLTVNCSGFGSPGQVRWSSRDSATGLQ